MGRYDWPGERDPGRRDRARDRAESVFELIARVEAEIIAEASALRADLLAVLNPDADTDVWLPLGPTTAIRGQAGSEPRVTGRVRDLLVSASGNRLYAATANGGVWYSNDQGDSFFPLGGAGSTAAGEAAAPGPSSLVTSCVAVDFGEDDDGSEDVVYAGTGEIRPFSAGYPGGKAGGIGVLRLTRSIADAIADPHVNPWTREAEVLRGAGVFRIAIDPGNRDIAVAATSIGLFKRSAAGEWSRVIADPFDFDSDDAAWCTDVVWMPARAGTPARLWVALVDDTAFSDTGVWVSEAGVDGPYAEVSLGGRRTNGRLGIAIHDADPSIGYVLGAGPRLWRIDGTTAREVRDIPRELFGSGDKDQSAYDLAVAVHPANPNEVVIGGSAVLAEQQTRVIDGKPTLVGGDWAASLFRLTVTGSAAADDFTCNFAAANQAAPGQDVDTYIGHNVHSDVHAVRYAGAAPDLELWVACDGGIYLSRQGGAPYTFVPRNAGLAVLEAGYVAGHPTSDGLVITGTQDNGAQRQVGDSIAELWISGDGGGVAFHPTRPAYYIGQYTRARWYANDGVWTPPLYRPVPPLTGKHVIEREEEASDRENRRASFYSDLDVIAGAGNNARVVIGTNRVWVSEDWDPRGAANTWVTLPSRQDPRAFGRRNTGLDTRRGNVRVVHWAGPPGSPQDRIVVLYHRQLVVFARAADGTWSPTVLEAYDEKCGDDEIDDDEISQPTSPVLPPLGAWSDLAPHDPGRGTHGSFYVAATGHAEIVDDVLRDSGRMDTLWWYDGTDTWHPTGLRSDAAGTRAPAFAVAVDPDDVGVVYAGTAVGVWRGTLSFSDAQPQWQWQIFSNGLPDAIVQDLAFFSNGDLKLLRAALQARGVWEIDLSAAPSSPRLTYLRAHAYDTRRRFPTDMTNPGDRSLVPRPFPYHASPDIRIRPAPGSGLLPAPASLPWRRNGFVRFGVWALQTAMHRSDPLVRPVAKWTYQFDARLRHHRADRGLPTPSDPVVDDDLWTAFVTDTNLWAAPWDGAEPDEADLYELVMERTTAAGVVQMDNRATIVDVLVHHRHFQPAFAEFISLLLVIRRIAAAEGLGGGVALSAGWKAAIVASLDGATPALEDGWQRIGRRSPSRSVTARMPRAVSFDLDLSDAAAFPPGSRWLLLAMVSATFDAVEPAGLPGATVEELVRGCHNVAAKLIEIAPLVV